MAMANREVHGTTGQIANIIVYVMIAQGLLMRFMIALQKRRFFHFVNSFDLTLSRRIHALAGLASWILFKFTLLSGAGLHSMMFGSTIYFIVLGETIFAVVIFLILEGIQLTNRIYWKVPLAVIPSRRGDYTKLLQSIRAKSKMQLNILDPVEKLK